jgi:hypothetical protein
MTEDVAPVQAPRTQAPNGAVTAPSSALRPLVPVVAVALLCTVLLAAWIRLRPLPIPPTVQVLLSVGVVVAVAAVLALVRRAERDARGAGDG